MMQPQLIFLGLWLLIIVNYNYVTSHPRITTRIKRSPDTNGSSPADSSNSSKPAKCKQPYVIPGNETLKLVQSSESLWQHFQWGDECDQTYKGLPSDARLRQFSGYGPCPSRRDVTYEYISQLRIVPDVYKAYAEMFRLYCKPNLDESFKGMVRKGYVYLAKDNSMMISKDSFLMTKTQLTFAETDEMELMLDIVALSQVFISWHKHLVGSIDPAGNIIPDKCFIEIVGRLHGLDLLLSMAPRFHAKMAYDMGLKMKGPLKELQYNFTSVDAVHNPDLKPRKDVARQCLTVMLGFMEFLVTEATTLEKDGCTHQAFRKFYVPRFPQYKDKVNEIDRIAKAKQERKRTKG